MSKKITESKLWGIVKEGLEKKEYGYICSNPEASWKKIREGFICFGIGAVQADVIGFKDIGTLRQPKLEVIAIEVKPDFPNYRQRHIDQAKRASFFAHKCFLAAPREFKPREIEIAAKSGVGLFRVDIQKRTLEQMAAPVPVYPDETNVIHLMSNLGYAKCTICDCYWNRKLVSKCYVPKNIFSKKDSFNHIKFICDICAQRIFKILSPDLRKNYGDRWRVESLGRKQETLKNNIKYIGEREDRHYKKIIKEMRSIRARYLEAWKIERLFRKQESLEKNIKYLRERMGRNYKKLSKK